MAHRELAQQLRGDHTREEIDPILRRIQEQLRPSGLHSIALGPQNAELGYEVFTEASPRRRSGTLVPRRSRGRVRMFTTIRLRGNAPAFPAFPIVPGTIPTITRTRNESGELVETTPEVPFEPVRGERVLERGIRTRQRVERAVSGGVVMRPQVPNEVRTASWSTGEEPNSRTNATHAERQFHQWFRSQDSEFKGRVEQIEVRIEKSPCKLCVPNLAEVVRWSPAIQTAALTYEQTYLTPPNATTLRSLGQLPRPWQLAGPLSGPPPPAQDEHDKLTLEER